MASVMRKAFLCVPLGMAGLALLVSGCGRMGADAPAVASTTNAGPKPMPVTVAALEHRSVERTIDVVGSLLGWEQVTVGAKRSGRVVRIHHDMGDRVAPGAPLVELEPTEARLAVQEAESRYLGQLAKLGISRQQAEAYVKAYGISERLLYNPKADEAIEKVPAVIEKRVARDKAAQNLARQKALTQRGAGTAQELEDAENAWRTAVAGYENAISSARTTIAEAVSAKIALSQAEQTLREMTVYAPRPGLLPPSSSTRGALAYGVARRAVSEGQILKDGEAVVDLVIEDPLRLRAPVPEQFSDKIQVGQLVRISARSHPGMSFEGKVTRISPSVDTISRTFQVEAIVPNERGLLRPGGLARASIVTEAHARAVVVPIESVVQFAGVTKLFLVENDKARAISDITTGKQGDGWVEVSGAGLPASGQVITTGQVHLADGAAVLVRRPEAETAPAHETEAAPARDKARR